MCYIYRTLLKLDFFP